MNTIYMNADMTILNKIGNRLKSARLSQNITQQSLAENSGISLSTLKKIEKGEISSFDSFLRVLRTLGMLDLLQPLIEKEQISPSEYYKLVNSGNKRQRQRAVGHLNNNKNKSEW